MAYDLLCPGQEIYIYMKSNTKVFRTKTVNTTFWGNWFLTLFASLSAKILIGLFNWIIF